MRDRAAERAGRRASDVDVDPLVVAGRVGELFTCSWVIVDPLRGPELLADGRVDLVEAARTPAC